MAVETMGFGHFWVVVLAAYVVIFDESFLALLQRFRTTYATQYARRVVSYRAQASQLSNFGLQSVFGSQVNSLPASAQAFVG